MKFIKVLKASSNMAKNHLRWLVYQVNNGGVMQYCNNGYADELLEYCKTHDIVQELKEAGCPVQGVEAINKIIGLLQSWTPSATCDYCGGTGESENEDEDGDIETERCEECHGDGEVEVDSWCEADEKFWMKDFDNWFYKLDMNKLDDWTEQSHNHSHFMDVIQQNKAVGDN